MRKPKPPRRKSPRLTRKAAVEKLRREGRITPLPYLLLLKKLGVEW